MCSRRHHFPGPHWHSPFKSPPFKAKSKVRKPFGQNQYAAGPSKPTTISKSRFSMVQNSPSERALEIIWLRTRRNRYKNLYATHCSSGSYSQATTYVKRDNQYQNGQTRAPEMAKISWLSRLPQALRACSSTWTKEQSHCSSSFPVQKAWWWHPPNHRHVWCLLQSWIGSATAECVRTRPMWCPNHPLLATWKHSCTICKRNFGEWRSGPSNADYTWDAWYATDIPLRRTKGQGTDEPPRLDSMATIQLQKPGYGVLSGSQPSLLAVTKIELNRQAPKIKLKFCERASSPLKSHPTTGDTSLVSQLCETEPQIATILPAYVNIKKDWTLMRPMWCFIHSQDAHARQHHVKHTMAVNQRLR